MGIEHQLVDRMVDTFDMYLEWEADIDARAYPPTEHMPAWIVLQLSLPGVQWDILMWTEGERVRVLVDSSTDPAAGVKHDLVFHGDTFTVEVVRGIAAIINNGMAVIARPQ